MALWCDKYRPKNLKKLDYGQEQGQLLKTLVKGADFPHLLFHGPSGAGKKTRIRCLLREIFGGAVDKMRIEHQVITTPSRKKIEVRTMASNFHMEVNPSDVGHDDRVVIQELIKMHAGTTALHVDARITVKVVVIMEADRLTKEAQQSLRRTMEKFMSSCRIILVADHISRIIPAVRSRTLLVRCPAPSLDTISEIICNVSDMDQKTGKQVALASGRNLRRAYLMAETMTLSKSDTPLLPHWQSFIKKLAKKVMEKQTPFGVDEIRTDLFQLMAHMIPADLMFEQLVKELLLLVPDQQRLALIHLAAFYESRSRVSNKHIIHLEAFIAQFMTACKSPV